MDNLYVMDNLDGFQKLVSTWWTFSILISIGLERRDPQGYKKHKFTQAEILEEMSKKTNPTGSDFCCIFPGYFLKWLIRTCENVMWEKLLRTWDHIFGAVSIEFKVEGVALREPRVRIVRQLQAEDDGPGIGACKNNLFI